MRMCQEQLAEIDITRVKRTLHPDVHPPEWVMRAWLYLGHLFGLRCSCGAFIPTIPTDGMCPGCAVRSLECADVEARA